MKALLLRHKCDRFLAVGAVCALLSNVIYIGGDAIGIGYAALIIVAYFVTLPLSYFAHALWTFSMPLGLAGFGRYILSSFTSFLIASTMMAVLCGPMGIRMIMAAPLATVAMIIYNFFATRWAIGSSTPSTTA